MKPERVAVVGAGPAGLFCAETLAGAGHHVTIFDRMPSPARKFLMAGRGGLNLTHSEPLERFLTHYGEASPRLAPFIRAFMPDDLRSWCESLGEETFVGTSGRVFPKSMKASPLLRAWLRRLAALGVRLETRQRFAGFDETGLMLMESPSGACEAMSFAGIVLALGGASWPRLGSDGAWSDILCRDGLAVAPFKPSNMGVKIDWTQTFRERFAGTPLKRIALTLGKRTVRGEAVVTETGFEGGAVYALSAGIRVAIERDGKAELLVDLRPDLSEEALAGRVSKPRQGQSTSTFLRKAASLSPAAISLLREGGDVPTDARFLARRIKALPLRITGVQGLDRAISSAGGVAWEEVDDRLMLRRRPGVFVAGEMLDWEAPTGGYLLQASFATGYAAAQGLIAYLSTGDQAQVSEAIHATR
ncbi:NAD(P)/FAD-dependent oxidoreductase [Microvirga massiliensis]|uniref:NAD(P)/FAD-dependent oxidoreductase n=1 Tax=Microvirga massiliensis TaxID=1033741 RepID=UPI00062B4510|nr:TIGR03862 family flavoprotein [Microvirga massiliensis]